MPKAVFLGNNSLQISQILTSTNVIEKDVTDDGYHHLPFEWDSRCAVVQSHNLQVTEAEAQCRNGLSKAIHINKLMLPGDRNRTLMAPRGQTLHKQTQIPFQTALGGRTHKQPILHMGKLRTAR